MEIRLVHSRHHFVHEVPRSVEVNRPLSRSNGDAAGGNSRRSTLLEERQCRGSVLMAGIVCGHRGSPPGVQNRLQVAVDPIVPRHFNVGFRIIAVLRTCRETSREEQKKLAASSGDHLPLMRQTNRSSRIRSRGERERGDCWIRGSI